VRRAALLRDVALARVSSITRWIVAGSIALTAALAGVAAHVFHGHSAASTTPSSASSQASSTSSSSGSDDSGSSSAAPSLQAPASTPQPSQSQGSVVSGGS
jgi:hypothetical protein